MALKGFPFSMMVEYPCFMLLKRPFPFASCMIHATQSLVHPRGSGCRNRTLIEIVTKASQLAKVACAAIRT